MPDRRDVASWLPGSGPRPASGDDASAGPAADGGNVPNYPGQRLGRPLEGSGSIPGIGRRFGALLIDWLACELIAVASFGRAATHPPGTLWIVVIFTVEYAILVGTAGATLGQRILGLQVERLDGGHPGLVRAVGRAVILALAAPAVTVLWDRDQRGLHELATGTLIVRR